MRKVNDKTMRTVNGGAKARCWNCGATYAANGFAKAWHWFTHRDCWGF